MSPSTAAPRKRDRSTSADRGTGRYDRSLTAEERFRERHERLLRVAAEVFAEHGFAASSLNEIVRRAAVSKRTFYEHFDDLRGCLLAVFDHAITTIRIAERIQHIEEPIERLRVGVHDYLECIGENAPLLLVLTREAVDAGPEYRKRRQNAYDRWTGLIVEGVEEARQRGLVTRQPDELTAYALVGAIEAVALRYIDRGQASRIVEAAPPLVELVLRAFR